jgi:hypothetical protein
VTAASGGNLGLALRQVRRFDEAMIAGQDAAAIFRQTGDRHGEDAALNNLGGSTHLASLVGGNQPPPQPVRSDRNRVPVHPVLVPSAGQVAGAQAAA